MDPARGRAHHPPMSPPPGPHWGQSPYPPQTATADPPPAAWGPPPSAPWGQPPVDTRALDSELQTWLVVACVGWFVGFMWLTGPLGWWKANDLRARYAALRAPEPSNVNVLRLLGIVTTVLSVLGMVTVCVVFGLFGVLFAAGGR